MMNSKFSESSQRADRKGVWYCRMLCYCFHDYWVSCLYSFVMVNCGNRPCSNVCLLSPPMYFMWRIATRKWLEGEVRLHNICACMHSFRAYLHEGWGPQVGEVTCVKLPHLTCKRDHIKMRNYLDRRVTLPKRVTLPT